MTTTTTPDTTTTPPTDTASKRTAAVDPKSDPELGMKADANPDADGRGSSLLADRLPMHAIEDLVSVIRLWEIYRNPRTRQYFRPEAERLGFDTGTTVSPDPNRPPTHYTPGQLEQLFAEIPSNRESTS